MAVKPFTVPTAEQQAKTLARRFIPLADKLRNMLTDFGLRAYKVSIVRVRWSGGERGYGVPTVVSENVVVPTPRVGDFASIGEVIQMLGGLEQGTVTVSEISGRYDEAELRGCVNGLPIPKDEEVFWEIELPGSNLKRRFEMAGVPSFQPGRLQWIVSLKRAAADRAQNGDVR